MAHTYKFAVVRLVPDPARGEAVNIGLLVFHPTRLDVRMLKSLRKVQALNASMDLGHLFEIPNALSQVDIPQRTAEQRHAMLQKFGIATLSELGEFSAPDADDYEVIVNRLLNRLVVPVPATRIAKAASKRLLTDIKSHFAHKKLIGDSGDIERHRIIPHFLISPQEQLYADLALKNSVMHLTEVVDFRVSPSRLTAKFAEAGLAAVTLDQGKKSFGTGTMRYFVYAASAGEESLITAHLSVAEQYADKVLNYESAADKDIYLKAMYDAAGVTVN